MNRVRPMVVAVLTLAAVAAFAEEPRYVVRLAATATMADPAELTNRLARTYGASIESVDGTTITLRVSPSRAELLRHDANVQSVLASAVPERIASHAIDWNTGVSYEYDGSGNVRRIGTDTFSYDVVGRLVEAHTGGAQRQYEYDAFGNRTRCTQNSGPCQDAETISALSNRSSVMTYDTAGNVTAHSGHAYTFDEFNMLKSDQSGALTREFLYNANDQRIGVLTAAGSGAWWRWTFRDPLTGKVLREFTSEGVEGTNNWKWQKDYVWRDGVLLATVQRNPNGSGTTTYHYHLDHLGTPRRVTDDADRIVGVHDYHAFGPEVSGGTDEESLSLMKYTGHERDVVDGQGEALDYMLARYYSPNLGRFLSVDPTWSSAHRGKPQTWNRYSYVMNNAVNLTDPDGKCPICIAIVLGVAGGMFGNPAPANAPGPDDMIYRANDPAGIGGAAAAVGIGTGASRFISTTQTVTRYMGAGEAETARRTRNIPNTDQAGRQRPTHVTTDSAVNSPAVAQQKYELPVPPTHRATVPRDSVPGGLKPTPDGRVTTSGGGSQAAATQPIPVRPDQIKLLKETVWDRIVGWFSK
jgi:RHS repeat-associated protein